MKNLLSVFLISLLFISACKAPAPDLIKSQELISSFLKEIQEEKWDNALSYYDPSENKEDRKAKLLQLHEAMGGIQNFEFVESISNTDPGQASYVILTYKIFRSKINAKESFRIINDEGKLIITQHNIETR